MRRTAYISTEDAAKIVGSKAALDELVRRHGYFNLGEMAMLYTYAKLYRDPKTGKFWLYGYAWDLSDVTDVVEGIAHGERCLLYGQKRFVPLARQQRMAA